MSNKMDHPTCKADKHTLVIRLHLDEWLLARHVGGVRRLHDRRARARSAHALATCIYLRSRAACVRRQTLHAPRGDCGIHEVLRTSIQHPTQRHRRRSTTNRNTQENDGLSSSTTCTWEPCVDLGASCHNGTAVHERGAAKAGGELPAARRRHGVQWGPRAAAPRRTCRGRCPSPCRGRCLRHHR